LKSKPKFDGGIKEISQAHRRISGNGSSSLKDFIDADTGYSQGGGQLGLAHSPWLQEFIT
jgi:hypothetical protein